MIKTIQDDYLSFVQTFKTKYDTGEFSIVWLNKIEVPKSYSNDLSDSFEIKIKDKVYTLISTINFYKNYSIVASQFVQNETTAEITFKVIKDDETLKKIRTYGDIDGRKINDADFCDLEVLVEHSALTTGNSYLEHYLLCCFFNV